jgi:hypothetical protein
VVGRVKPGVHRVAHGCVYRDPKIRTPHSCHGSFDCVLLTGTRSRGEHYGQRPREKRRINRPDTWQHRPAVHHLRKALANREPSTQGTKRTNSIVSVMSATDPKQTHSSSPRAPTGQRRALKENWLRSALRPIRGYNGVTDFFDEEIFHPCEALQGGFQCQNQSYKEDRINSSLWPSRI